MAPTVILSASALLQCDGAMPDPAGLPVQAASQALSEVEFTRTLRSIEVTPGDALLEVDLNQKATLPIKVVARYNDRSIREVSALASFSIDNTSIGSISAGLFESDRRGSAQLEFATISVRYKEGAVEASGTVTVTVAWLRTTGPTKDLLFTLPYMGGTESTTVPFATSAQAVDAFLAVDTTGSMGPEIISIRDGLDTAIVPAVRASAKDVWFGVGAVEDFPNGSFGSPACGGMTSPDDQPLILLSAMNSSTTTFKTAIGTLLRGTSPRGCGADAPEGQMEALYQIATGAGNVVTGVVNIPPHKDKGKGGVEFRAGALPVISMISDASFHTVGEATKTCFGQPVDYTGAVAMAAHSRTATTTALKNICARVVGVSIETGVEDGCIATKDLTQFATDTGALVPPQAWDLGTRPMGCMAGQCCTGPGGAGEAPNASGLCPLVLRASGSTTPMGPLVAASISTLVKFAAYDVTAQKSGGSTAQDGSALPMGKTTADFISAVKAIDGTAPPMPAGLKTPTASGDKFLGVVPGSTVRYTLELKNDFAQPSTRPLAYKARFQTVGAGCATLDDRDILIIVPGR